MTVRLASCRELSEDLGAVIRLANLYMTVEKSATPISLLFPWFPGPAKRAKDRSTKDMYCMLKNYVDIRRKADTTSIDSIDVLIHNGESDDNIVGVCVSRLF
jgi:hypothetical protein